jgi:hypothetical protein
MPLSLDEHLATAERDYAALARFADRRERFLDALDWTALDEQFVRETSMTDDLINDDLASLWLYIDHLGRWSADAALALGARLLRRLSRPFRDYTPH